jgi:hypothetical protein
VSRRGTNPVAVVLQHSYDAIASAFAGVLILQMLLLLLLLLLFS